MSGIVNNSCLALHIPVELWTERLLPRMDLSDCNVVSRVCHAWNSMIQLDTIQGMLKEKMLHVTMSK